MRTIGILLFCFLPLVVAAVVLGYKALVERLWPHSYRALKYKEERLTPPDWER